MPGPILVGYDGSGHGEDALELGRLLARLADAELLVVCAYPEDPLGQSAAAVEVAQGVHEDAERRLDAVRERLGPDARAELQAVGGSSPSAVLHELAERRGAQAIVVGATHHGTALRRLAGSTPEHVVDHAPCPVAVAPEGFAREHASALRQIAVAFDASPESAHALDVAAELARGTGARLRLVSAVNAAAVGMYPPLDVSAYEQLATLAREEARRRLDEAVARFAGSGLAVEGAVRDGDPGEVLVDESGADDLLVTGSRGQGAFRRVLLGSVSTHLLRHAVCPVVIVPRGPGEPPAAA